MKCKKCGNDLGEESKFCGKCGEKINVENSDTEKVNDKKFESPVINDIETHLEFLGYSSELINENGVVSLVSKHTSKANIVCASSRDNFVYVTSTWNGLKEITTVEQYKYLNKMVSEVALSRIFIDNYGDLRIRSLYMGEYNKKRFGEFLDRLLADANQVLTDETFIKLFVK